jgi:nucleotide-binding universal stress UspA family protein
MTKKNNASTQLHIEQILVPIDFSEHSKHALQYAVSFAKQFNSELILIYVVEQQVYPADLSFGQVAVPGFEQELRDRAKKELEELIKTSITGGVKARPVVQSGKPFLEILDTAEDEEVDLIIIATHGHTGVEHLLFGSTAEKVVRKASCPVLVVR